MTESEFLNSRAWKIKRKAILRRDGYMCAECRKYGKARPAVLVHHIVPFEEAPELALESKNLESLCLACHNKAHPEKAAAKNRSRY